ncbi:MULTISPECIES: Cof-type HAD-IIB family hydrolase [Carnobacterium]|uniref:Cof-type HAD-IIB family hydrolase n=1 Tax=Carnobacterium antarcticum TaxID=2126436 RepID=A0ABW4NN69_9LACT|nr:MULTISPECIES: Cof-type HAD-IIB family hydrolase [unclassified Carnobacterium]ALV20880.1 Hydrolase (HAD superfamily) [Carnobacterium sp. CP1]QQP71038.1 Cof-type HAD-IIB family hydrolase [Carnobacterium sp. CS13]
MRKKMLFFDIDGTLLNDEKKALPSTKKALKELKENGHEIVIATGRNLSLAQSVIDEFDFDNYIICNGAAGYYHNRLVYENKLDRSEFDRLLKVADTQNHAIIYESAEALRRRHAETNIKMTAAMKSFGAGVPPQDQDYYLHHPMYQGLIFYSDSEKAAYENGQFPKFKFIRWHDSGVDIVPHDGSKAHTILKFAKSQGFDIEDTIAFGDGLNDLEMISEVGIGVAMGNALETVKLRADKITSNCNEDGIYVALKELHLI